MFAHLLLASYSLAFTSVWLWLIVVVFLLTVAGTALYYRRTNPMLSSAMRITLGVLRGLALAALFFAFAEPLLVVNHTNVKQPTIAVVVDNSSSMAQNRQSGEQFKSIATYLKDIESKIPAGTKIVQYALSDTITENGVINGSYPVTAIGDGLSDLSHEFEDQNLQGIVLLTDGVSNLGKNPATEAKKIGVPITTVGFGNPNPLPDISIAAVNCNPIGFAGKEFPVEVTIESRGFENLRLPLKLREGEKLLVQKDIDLVGNGKQQTVQLTYIPPSEGQFTLEVSAPVQSNEESDKNNSKQIQVKIRKSKIKILLAASYINWDYKFLHKALLAKKDFDLDSYIESQQRVAGTIPFPENIDALNEYDAVILYDFDSDWLLRHKQLFDAFFDRSGKGIFVLCGENFGNKPKNDYTAQLLPYHFADGKQAVVYQQIPLALTERGKIHPLMRLDSDVNQIQRILNTMPPFTGYLAATEPNKEAVVIADVPTVAMNQPQIPTMGAQRYRSGKVATLSAFPLWRTDFFTKSYNEGDSTLNKFMENMVLWLVARDDIERIAITPEKPIFIAGESVKLNARVLDESYQPVSDAEVDAKLKSQDNPKDTNVVSFQLERPGNYVAGAHYLPPGKYQVEGIVKRDGQKIASPTTSFIVEPYSLEDLSHISDFDMLKRISELSGGKFYAADDTASILKFPATEPKSMVKRSELSLFDYPGILIFIILMLCIEWYLRKKNQLL